MAEFLPLCDVLFNVISLAGYFCDVVFDVVMGYALLERGYKGTFAAAISIILTSLFISQVISLRWYLAGWWADERGGGRGGRWPWVPLALHVLQLGVLWRYARLLVPVHLSQVKHQVRDLCMLRLVHAFCEAAPMLLLQLHVLFRDAELAAHNELTAGQDPSIDEPAANKAFAELNVISAGLSLFSVCWALASFSKNVRRQNVDRLLLTWLGVIFQFLWRLGTISARVCALTVYALVYEHWVFLVIGLHWVSMFLWLISPKNVFHGERISLGRKAGLSALIAFVYVFAYINLQQLRHRQKMVTFYVVMIVENSLLVGAWWWSGRAPPRPARTAALALAATAAGLACMLLYYRFFHVRRLGYLVEGAGGGAGGEGGAAHKQAAPAAVPGVFNCRFSNPVSVAGGRKKKKPTSFVPPRCAPPPAPAPFWRRPLPAHIHHGGSSENEGSSVGSRVNIQQKLQEKKQKQLAELRVIEEEIKQGKIVKTGPVAAEEIYSSLQRQPIPRAKTHAEPPSWPTIEMTHSYQNYPIPHTCNVYPTYTEIKPEYPVQNFQNEPNEINDPLKLRRLKYENRDFYENPTNLNMNIRNENRTPIRSPNYLIGETRSYDANGCGSPRNVLNNSPRTYNMNETPNFDAIDKPRQPNYEERQGEYSGYCETQYNSSKDPYVSALHNVLANVQSIDSIRPYTEQCSQYSQNCERLFPYGKKQDQMRKMQRCRTPEILLAPHYLEGCNRQVCCHWGPPYTNRKKEEGAGSSGSEGGERSPADVLRPPSDIDSQISLPRSYTLPREFRYWRRRARPHHKHTSNNSSDGDVDSCDNDSSWRSKCSGDEQLPARRQRRRHPPRKHNLGHKPETKL